MSQTTQQPTRPTPQPFVVGPDDGEHVWFLATRMTIKATAQTTAGALGVVEWRAAPGFSPPLHIHHGEDEAFWLLEGSMTVLCDGQLFEASTGSFIWLPRGRPHTFRVEGDTPVHGLLLSTPADHVGFYAEGATRPKTTRSPSSTHATSRDSMACTRSTSWRTSARRWAHPPDAHASRRSVPRCERCAG